tara:strand:+ start:45 stop:656 length:612 start_codon:yes stop_codon:yes gene_type:complete
MRKLGTIDLEILDLAIKEKGTFDENNLESSELKRFGVGKILDTLASLKDRKLISLNENGSFSITELARNILWDNNIPTWAKILRLLQIKSCREDEIIKILMISEEEISEDIERLRKNQFVLMAPQRQEGKIIRVYEILSEGIVRIDKTDAEGFENIKFEESKSIEILSMIDKVIKEIQDLEIDKIKKDTIVMKLSNLKTRLEI